MLQQAQPSPPGNGLFNTSETLPDTANPGIYLVGAYDGNVIPGVQDPYPGTVPPQHGDGVLVRLRIQGKPAGGFSSLQITPFQQGPGMVGPFLKDSAGNLVGDGNADGFVDNVSNAGLVVGSGACTDSDGDTVPDANDNCPNHPNIDQLNFDAPYGDTQGDACDTDDDNDGLLDTSEPATCSAPQPDHPGRLDPDCDDDLRSDGPNDPDSGLPIVAGPDNCISVANANQTNTDGDAFGDACDLDDDNDGVSDSTDNCPLVANANQANYDLQWGDTQGGDACDTEADGDGYSNAAELNVGTNSLDHCGNTAALPPPAGTSYPVSSAWPADLRSDGISINKLNIVDLGSYTAPLRRINTSPRRRKLQRPLGPGPWQWRPPQADQHLGPRDYDDELPADVRRRPRIQRANLYSLDKTWTDQTGPEMRLGQMATRRTPPVDALHGGAPWAKSS